MRNNARLILEIIWIVTGVLCVGISIRIFVTTGDNDKYIFALMGLVSFLMAYFRHGQRKNT